MSRVMGIYWLHSISIHLQKDTIFGVKYQNNLVILHLLNYKEMFVVTPIYIRYVVIPIVLLIYMLTIELFILHNFVHIPSLYPYRFSVHP